jgi:hypothetical protein
VAAQDRIRELQRTTELKEQRRRRQRARRDVVLARLGLIRQTRR